MFWEYLEHHDLFTMLLTPSERIPFPKASDRKAWEAVDSAHRAKLIKEGAAWRSEPYAPLKATQFLAFCRDGSRAAYENPYFQRRRKLMRLALAECAQYDGQFMDEIIDGIWLLCEESFWGISAHNGSHHPGARPAAERPLPDIENPYIDLFAAQTAALLSWICHLLDDALNDVTPILLRRVALETKRRVLKPFFHHDDFWWMGMIRRDVNNWTPWILSNVISCLLLSSRDDRLLADGLSRAMRMLDAYLAVVPEDGGCDEGAAYWNMAGGSLLDCLELLFHATGGQASFYGAPLIRKIGSFPLAAHIAGPYFWNFADCDAKPHLDGERLYRYGSRTENRELMALGASIESGGSLFGRDTPEISRVLWRLFNPIPKTGAAPPRSGATLPHLQIWARNHEGVYFAIKGGHNGENHNHNDVGSILVYTNGAPAIVDMGNITYTAKTFSPDRYELFNTRSKNHNVPLIGGYEQSPGAPFAARDVQFGEHSASIDIAGAYPVDSGAKRSVRTVTWSGLWRMADAIELSRPLPITWVFITREKPALSSGTAVFCGLELSYNPALRFEIEEMPTTDARMALSFPGSLWRLTFTAAPKMAHHEEFTMQIKG